MSVKTPRVSVLTPIYNTNPVHLRECIESILNQTFKDFEFLILNDSPDNKEIEKIVLEYAKQDKRIKYSKNDKNMGITPSRNKLLKMAKGEYLAIFDHDDISVPTRLEQEVTYLDANPDIGVVSGWLQCFGSNQNVIKNPETDLDIKVSLMDNCYIAHTASMIRKSILIENNIEYESFYSPAEDYCLWLRLMNVTYFYNLQTVLVKYRCDANQTTNTKHKEMDSAHDALVTEVRNKFPEYWRMYKAKSKHTIFRLRLLNIPLLKIKNNKIYLFEFIPIFKIRWE